ncbi:MAG: hypothetical protein AABX03_04850, partial [Nanoarchaeota archaeon]
VRLDIIAGIKNAVERGYSIDEAKTSLINAGYSVDEINEAVNYVTGGVTLKDIIPKSQPQSQTSNAFQINKSSQPLQPSQKEQNETKIDNQQISNQTLQQKPLTYGTSYEKAMIKHKFKFPWKIFFLGGLLIILILILISVIIFRESIISFLETLLG